MPAWKGRQVATLTHALSPEAAAYVDDAIAPRLTRCGARALDTVVAQAIAVHHPDRHAEREASAKKQTWDVTLTTPTASEYAATSELHVIGDTLTLTRLHKRLSRAAAAAGKAGDDRPLGVRKAEAFAALMNGEEPHRRRTVRGPADSVLYLHMDKADLEDALVRTAGSAAPNDSARSPPRRSWNGSARPTPGSSRSSGWTPTTPSTGTTHPSGCASR